jgi:putative ABC transport system permease protein
VIDTRTQGFGGLPPDLVKKLNALPEVGSATGVQLAHGKVKGRQNSSSLSVADSKTVGDVFDMKFIHGNARDHTPTGILVSKKRAETDNLTMGSTVTLSLLDGVEHRLTVQEIYEKDDMAGPYTISDELFRSSGSDVYYFAIFGNAAPGVSEKQVLAAAEGVAKAYPNGKLLSRSAYVTEQSKQIDLFLNLVYGLLALAVLIAVFGITNTLSLSVYERSGCLCASI